MKKNSIKVVAMCLCTAMVGSLVGAGVYASAQNDAQATETENVAVVSNEVFSEANEIDASEFVKDEPAKDETVYVISNADGSTQKLIVSESLKTADGKEYKTEEIEKELPVDMKITYTLDGNEISAEELAGKSGHVVMSYSFTNKQYEDVEIGGKTERIYVPFVMLTGMILDNENFSNVEVSHGKVVDDGSRYVVVGVAFPGTSESLAIDKDTFEIPESFEVEADVTNFKLSNTYTVSTNELFNRINTDKLDDFEGLSDSLAQLTDAMDQLMNGSSELYDGLGTLLDKSGELVDGITQLHEGAGSLADGAAQLTDGIASANDGAASLHAGADQVAAGAGSLKDGIGALTDGSVSLEEGAAALSTGLDTISAGSGSLNAGAKAVFESLLATANQNLTAAGLKLPELTIDNYAAVLDGVLKQTQGTPAYQTIAALKGSLDSYNQFYTGLLTYTAGVDSAAAGAGNLKAGASALKDGVSQVSAGAAQLAAGTAALKEGAATLDAGLDTIYSGSKSLKDGAFALDAGVTKLFEATPELTDGITKLHDGAGELADGIKRFNDEGITKIVDAFDGNLEVLADRIHATSEVSSRYCSFADSADTDSQVKFIYKTQTIG